MSEFEEILSVNDISKKLGVSEETVRRWIREGKLKSINTIGKKGEPKKITMDSFNDFMLTYKKRKIRKPVANDDGISEGFDDEHSNDFVVNEAAWLDFQIAVFQQRRKLIRELYGV